MSTITFRFFPREEDFSDKATLALVKIDPNITYSKDKGEKYAQVKINEHLIVMPEEFFPSAFRKIIQKELRKVTVMDNSFLSADRAPANERLYRIGSVEISVTGLNNYFFVGDNITGMLRAIILAKRLKKDLVNYIAPSRFYTESFMITKEIKNLSLENKVLREKSEVMTKVNKSLKKALYIVNESAKNLLSHVYMLELENVTLKTNPPRWKFWLWNFKLA